MSAEMHAASDSASERVGSRATTGARQRRRRPGAAAITCAALGAAAAVVVLHWPVLSARALSFDDGPYLTENPLVRNPSWRSAWRFASEVLEPSTVQGYYQPLTMISLMLDYAAGGRPDRLWPFHLTSLVLHGANTALVVMLLYLLFGNAWAAGAVGLLFGLHPMTVEPIAWVGERKTLLASFFALGGLICYIWYVRRASLGRYICCAVLFILALLSKPTTTPLPLLLLLLDYWPLRRLSGRAVLEKLPLLCIAVVSAVITVVSQARTAAVIAPTEYSPLRAPLILAHNIVFYLYKMVWPANLSSHYAFPEPLDLSQPTVVAGVLGTPVLLAVLLISWRWTRAPLTAWLFFFVAISPTMGVIGFTVVIASDKYAYLPALGLLLLLTAGLTGADAALARFRIRRFARVGALLLVLMVAGLEAHAMRAYAAIWADTEQLFRHMLAFAPQAALLHRGLGNDLLEQGRTGEALYHYSQALEFGGEQAEHHGSLGAAFLNMGRFADAAGHCRAALELQRGNAKAHQGLADALAGLGQVGEAIQHYREALRLKPNYVAAHYNLAGTLAGQRDVGGAIEHYSQAARLDPTHYKARYNLAQLLLQADRTDEALGLLREALRCKPDLAEAHLSLANTLAGQGKAAEAVTHYREALRLTPDAHVVANNLAWLLATAEDPQIRNATEAVQLAEQACQATNFAEPSYLDTLAAAYAAAGRFGEAAETARKALTLARDQAELLADLEHRLKLYESRQPYRPPARPAP